MPSGACRTSRASSEFFTVVRSLVLAKMLGREMAMSPGQTRRSRFAPSTMQLVPFVTVLLLDHVLVSGKEISSVALIL